MPDTQVVWAPQPGPQKALIDCPYPEIFFGGARGGGKTNGVLGKFGLKAKAYGRAFNAVFFRQEMPQADDLIEDAKEIYLPSGATWHEQKKMFVFKTGGRVRFRPLENEDDANKYQGQNVTHAAVEEAGNYSSPKAIDKLFGALRSKHGVPVQLILTANPGGVGHSWIRERYVKPAPLGMRRLTRVLPNGREHPYIYIPSRVTDNKILSLKDPGYVDRLHLVGSPELVRAWLEGDWEIHEGSYFPEFGQRHIVEPFPIPRHWSKLVGFDWGYHSPFATVFGAISSGKTDGGIELPYPKGAIVIYRELTGKGLDNTEMARRILALKAEGEEWETMVADPAIFANQGGPSIADQFKAAGVYWRPADNDRISGWNEIRRRLKPERPMLYISTACPYLLETLPALPIDDRRPEDADTEADDHACDALRYLCKERALTFDYKASEPAGTMGRIRVKKHIDEVRRRRDRPRL